MLTKLTLTSVNVADIHSSRDAEPAQRSTVSLNPTHKHTSDPYTGLTPGTAGTVTGYDGRLGQFSDHRVSYDASELVFRVADMYVTLTGH